MGLAAINTPILGREEVAAANSVIRSGALTSAANGGGRHVREFEAAASSFVGSKYAVAVNSGTAALQASLHALMPEPGGEVLVPSFTFVGTANAVVAAGAKPVFVDILKDNYTMDPADLEQKITDNTRAIIPVHLYGHVAYVDEITEISKKYSVPVIEDAAQSLGSTYKGKHTGTFFEMGCFSMYPGKVMTAGEGGFIVTNSKKHRDRLTMIRNHGMVRGYDTRVLGMNLRLPEISAAIATVQLGRLPGFLRLRQRNAKLLSEMLAGVRNGRIISAPRPRKEENVNWYLYTVAVKRRNALLKHLRGSDSNSASATTIGAAAYYSTPVHKTPFYRGAHTARGLGNTDWAAARVLSLPVHPKVTTKEIRLMADAVRDAP